MKKLKRAFTIVELVIVIAVIAILAAVLIPTFSNIIRKANISSDTQLVRNLNTALVVDRAVNGEHKTMQDALDAAFDAGYDLAKINTRANQNEILWDSVNDVYCYYDVDQGIIYTPDVVNRNTNVKNYQYWKIVNTNDEEFRATADGHSIYAGANFKADTIVLNGVGFDAGNNTIIKLVDYSNNSNEARGVIIRTNGGNLTVNAPADTVKHYGEANVVDIQEVAATSYHEYGDVLTVKIAKGRLVITEEAEIGLIKAVATNDVFTDIKIGLVGNVELPTVTRDDVALDSKTEAGHYTQLVLEVQQLASETTAPTASNTEYVWIEIDIDGSNNKTTKTEVASSKIELTESTKIQDNAISNSVTEITKVSNAEELDAALEANKKYIMFTADITHSNQVELTYSVTIDGDGHKLTSTGIGANEQIDAYNTPGWKFYHGVLDVIAANIDVKITNIDLINNRASGTGIALGRLASHVNVEVENVYLNAPQYDFYTHVGSEYQNATFKYVRFEPSSYNAVYWRGANGKFVAYNTKFTSLNTSSAPSNGFTTFAIERPLLVEGEVFHSDRNDFTFINCEFYKVQTGTALQTLMTTGANNTINFNNTELENSGIIEIVNIMIGDADDNETITELVPTRVFVDGKEELPVNVGYMYAKKSTLIDGRTYWPTDGYYSGTFNFNTMKIHAGYHLQDNHNGTWTVVAD